MSAENENCVWIGIGTDLKDGVLYDLVKNANELLVKEYRGKSGFAGSKYPHLNLYDLSVPRASINPIKDRLREIADTQEVFIVKTGKVGYFPFGLFYLEVEDNMDLKNLHDRVVKQIVDLKGACIDKDYLAPHRTYSEAQKDSLMRYGNPHVLEQFQPHITLGFIGNKENNLLKIQEKINIEPTEWQIDNIHIAIGGGAGDGRVFNFKVRSHNE